MQPIPATGHTCDEGGLAIELEALEDVIAQVARHNSVQGGTLRSTRRHGLPAVSVAAAVVGSNEQQQATAALLQAACNLG
jgi:hypothetical protein